jgi:hypothetical protein
MLDPAKQAASDSCTRAGLLSHSTAEAGEYPRIDHSKIRRLGRCLDICRGLWLFGVLKMSAMETDVLASAEPPSYGQAGMVQGGYMNGLLYGAERNGHGSASNLLQIEGNLYRK